MPSEDNKADNKSDNKADTKPDVKPVADVNKPLLLVPGLFANYKHEIV